VRSDLGAVGSLFSLQRLCQETGSCVVGHKDRPSPFSEDGWIYLGRLAQTSIE